MLGRRGVRAGEAPAEQGTDTTGISKRRGKATYVSYGRFAHRNLAVRRSLSERQAGCADMQAQSRRQRHVAAASREGARADEACEADAMRSRISVAGIAGTKQRPQLTTAQAAAAESLWPSAISACDAGGGSSATWVDHGQPEARAARGDDGAQRMGGTPTLVQAKWMAAMAHMHRRSECGAALRDRGEQLRAIAAASSALCGDAIGEHAAAVETKFKQFATCCTLDVQQQGRAGPGLVARCDLPLRRDPRKRRLDAGGVLVHDFPHASDPNSRFQACAAEAQAGLEGTLQGPAALINTACSKACANVRFTLQPGQGVLRVTVTQTAPIGAAEPVLAAYALRSVGGLCPRCGKEMEATILGQSSAVAADRDGSSARRVFVTGDGRAYWKCGVTGATGWL